ncbi:MAG TPA: sugar phosphate isomerase/epimerase [Segetibacter sp.]|nr:sugar phosphate isomerase/epimerase [Segetibacter sp.]
MPTSRRTFLKNSSIALAASSFLPGHIFGQNKKQEMLGIQLYSIRDDMKTDPLGSLKQLVAMGYKNVEHANYVDRKFYGYSASEFKKVLDDLGLKMPSGHTVMSAKDWDENKKDFTDKWKQTVEDAATVGQQYVVSPWLDESLRKNYDDLVRFLQLFNKCGELCKKSGMKFGYHNHNFEFMFSLNNKLVYDIILANTDPSLVAQQLDIGNMYGAGGRAEQIIAKHPDRFELLHVKDEIKVDKKGEMEDGYESTVLGKGVIPVKQILDLAKKSGGTTQFVIEQESYQGKTPIECAKEDFAIMKNWGY